MRGWPHCWATAEFRRSAQELRSSEELEEEKEVWNGMVHNGQIVPKKKIYEWTGEVNTESGIPWDDVRLLPEAKNSSRLLLGCLRSPTLREHYVKLCNDSTTPAHDHLGIYAIIVYNDFNAIESPLGLWSIAQGRRPGTYQASSPLGWWYCPPERWHLPKASTLSAAHVWDSALFRCLSSLSVS